MVPRTGKMKALVAVARKLLVVVWHVLTKGEADRYADPVKVARSLFGPAFDIKGTIRISGLGWGLVIIP